MKENLKGISKEQEVRRRDTITDLRSWEEKLSAYLKTQEGIYMFFGVLAVSMLIYGSLFEIPMIMAAIYTWWLSLQKISLPFRMPKSSYMLDPNDPPAGKHTPGPASGISYFGNERGSKKELWFANGDMRTHIILFGSTGAGKALKMNEKILTPKGWVLNKDLKMGDEVCTPDGVSKITGIYPQGKLPMYRMNFSDYRNKEISGDHLWEVQNKNWKKAKVLSTVQIKQSIENFTAKVSASKKYESNSFFIPLCGVQHKNIEDVTLPLPAYVLGALLGCGAFLENNIDNHSDSNLILETKDLEIIEKINFLIKDTNASFKKLPSSKNYLYQTTENFLEISGSIPNNLLDKLQSLNLIGFKSYNKFIPEIYKNSSVKQKMELLQGYLDTNGDVGTGKIGFSTGSKQLAADMQQLLFSLGAIVKISERDSVHYSYSGLRIKGIKEYRTYVKCSNPSEFFSLNRKKLLLNKYQCNISNNSKHALKLGIVSVEDLKREEECQCIKIADERGVFITEDYVVTHNTEALISLAFNALVHGSGFVYVDGKGDNSLWSKIFSIARTMGREDDLLVINYMTGSRDVFGPQKTKLSNTLNPFTTGSSGGLTELLVSLMDESGGDNAMWKGRAISLISSIMMALVDMRDRKEILLDVDTIREYLILEKIQALSKRRDLPAHVTHSIRSYLRSLPGYQETTTKQSETVMDQHGYLQMQFTKILGSLADSYGYIFKTNLGEVDFWDVVLNRRILVVLLPALEKSPEELANLGKIIVACLKQMMAAGLGTTLEGSRLDVIDTKPTNSPAPFMCILDEYGYYAVKGAAVMPAQARSLGFSMVFASQDLPALQKSSPEEAASTLGNCNIKIFMKVEDTEKTYELALKSGGRSPIAKKGSMEKNPSGMSGMFPAGFGNAKSANYEMEDRIQLGDLKNQREGEAHILFKDEVVRADMFYAAPATSDHLQLNHFLPVKPPEKEELLKLDDGIKLLQERLLGEPFRPSDAEFLEIKLAQKIITENKEKNIQTTVASVFGYLLALSEAPAENFRQSVKNLMIDGGDDDDGKINIFDREIEEELENYKDKDEDEEEEDDDDNEDLESEREERRRLIEKYGRREEKEKNKRNFKQDFHVKKDTEDNEEDNDDDDDEEEDDDVFLNENETREKFKEVEKLSGSSEDDARMSADRLIEDIKAASEYPKRGVPDEQSIDDVLSIIKELNEDVKEHGD